MDESYDGGSISIMMVVIVVVSGRGCEVDDCHGAGSGDLFGGSNGSDAGISSDSGCIIDGTNEKRWWKWSGNCDGGVVGALMMILVDDKWRLSAIMIWRK